MRLGIFGGTFDPVHYGHLLLAEACREGQRLDQVWFMPTAVPPHKQQRESTAATQRVEMLELALAGDPAFHVCSYEVARGGVNYTVDTLAHLKGEDPDRELFFLMGADSLRDLHTWKDPRGICQLATPLVVARGIEPEMPTLDLASLEPVLPTEALARIRLHQVPMPCIELSSSDIRQRVAQSLSIRFRTHRTVEKYIEAHHLYRPNFPANP